jgi:N-acetylglucosaminylphosphatidylinositol deacetylase
MKINQRLILSRLASRLASRRALRLLPRILFLIFALPLLLQILVAYIIGNDPRLLPSALQQANNLLIVTAHPDDECLFFAPSIMGVLDRTKKKGGLLVLSTGKPFSFNRLSQFCLFQCLTIVNL